MSIALYAATRDLQRRCALNHTSVFTDLSSTDEKYFLKISYVTQLLHFFKIYRIFYCSPYESFDAMQF
jgi:hypothetical protein